MIIANYTLLYTVPILGLWRADCCEARGEGQAQIPFPASGVRTVCCTSDRCHLAQREIRGKRELKDSRLLKASNKFASVLLLGGFYFRYVN